jgi:hypothetical protein
VRHVRMLGLCLVAALALGAYAVSSASALEWGKCELVGSGGNYTGPNCTKGDKAKPKGSGEYEWRKATEVAEQRVAEGKTPGVPFTGASPEGAGGVLTTGLAACSKESEYYFTRVTRQKCAEGSPEGKGHYEIPAGVVKIKCLAEHAVGTTEGKNKVANVQVTFTGCELAGPCTGIHGEKEGEIKTNVLKGKLGWLSKPAKEVGVVLEPASKPKTFAEFECLKGTDKITVGQGNKREGAWYTSSGCYGECLGTTPEEEKHGGYDRLISPITPVNEMTKTFTQVYAVNKEGRNEPEKLEGKPLYQLEDFIEVPSGNSTVWQNAGEEITNVNTPEEAGEIKA